MTDERTARERVVTAADELFYARGVRAVGMDAVRAAAGVPLKRIYAMFASKEDLLVAVLEQRRTTWDAGIASVTDPAATAREQLLAIFDFLDDWFREPTFRGCAFINTYGEMGPGSAAASAVVREQKTAFGEHVARLVADAGAPAWLAPQIVLLAEGAQTVAAVSGDADAARHARAAAETLLDAATRTTVPA
ncbi:TetR/AcrR family transcriptional regulator [Isoptericola sp. S6320L]|uniref:TetR/AcrR family transcriptional regulator n=1 Tax=Isoptericola sp. S6320L TaxID=2926411 RepID=UPI001FF15BC8|nr:TetR/AcrR family transcriptional regulator [Isoptericola sp. S6320L]MCK0116688.1 TetR/AcrR family transcriptional regulator [Isoptericola sp. S6320L]